MMHDDLKKSYIQVLFRFRKTGLDFPKISDLNITELFVMAGISNNAFLDKSSCNLTEIQNNTHITKGAISLMFTSLEKRGYVIRETDKTNRRKITVALTPEGERVITEAQKQADALLDATLSRFGAEKSQQLVALLNELSDITDEMKRDGVG
ncbi:MAG: transcriptional regulator [Oscillospiraceae bacterium]|jgi:DNA-binding MarR family transcriptional regulator|nr:transcriptional regulator [Oscillospiraceae bacterium]